jgi:hypothetical protein
MAHPADDGQLSALVGDAWRGMIAGLPIGSYAALAESGEFPPRG